MNTNKNNSLNIDRKLLQGMKIFINLVDEQMIMRFKYMEEVQNLAKKIQSNQRKQEILCQYCGEIFIGKAYGGHIRKHKNQNRSLTRQRNQSQSCFDVVDFNHM